jgi:hypothetical protein
MATYPLTWMADVLRAAGCKVVEEPGWKTRGRPRSFAPIGIMFHHDASPAGETSNGADVIVNGRPGLEGPLGNVWLAYDGTWHCCAAGSANHAGEGDGSWGDIDDGNHDTLGVETDHTTDEAWQPGQQSSGLRGTDALRRHMRMSDAQVHRRILAHKEWAPSRKVDPDPMDMDRARANLIAYDPAAEEDTFMDRIEARCTVAEALPADEWSTLRVRTDSDDGALHGIVAGPARYLLNAAVTLVHVPMGGAVMLRAVETGHDVDDVHASRDIDQRGAVEHHGTEHFTIAAQGSLDEGEWLRLQIHPSAEVSVTEVRAAVTTW